MENIKLIAKEIKDKIEARDVDQDFWFKLGVLIKEIEEFELKEKYELL